ncbi:MAG: tripartite tricarboxylate transporter TctB family protein [Paracoccus denitrificans]|uniref:Tripartite tricarboxylate transporter TctB family protein n=1 Tax=Paracoccus denitrificans TaxID=266 RepID=A0A533I598_PARDE|nr:MAG: tripartite tricarboxylate transporter TctB family protein [Paracoccus denitrificans]
MGRIFVVTCVILAAAFMWIEAGSYPDAARRLPQLIAGVVILLGLIAILQTGFRLARANQSGEGAMFTAPDPQNLLIGIGFAVLIAIYIWAIPRLGYLPSTVLMLLIPLAALRPVGWAGIAVTLLAVVSVIWGIFIWFLGLPIPLFPGA